MSASNCFSSIYDNDFFLINSFSSSESKLIYSNTCSLLNTNKSRLIVSFFSLYLFHVTYVRILIHVKTILKIMTTQPLGLFSVSWYLLGSSILVTSLTRGISSFESVLNNPISWNNLENSILRQLIYLPSLLLVMKEGAIVLIAVLVNTLLSSEQHRMIFKFLPPMTLHTIKGISTSVMILSNEICSFPILTRNWIVLVYVWFPSEILPIMGVDTKGLCRKKKISFFKYLVM